MTRPVVAALAVAILGCGAQPVAGPAQGGEPPDGGLPPGQGDASSPTKGTPDAGASSRDGAADAVAHPHDAAADGGGHPIDAGTGPGVLVHVTNGCPVDVWIHATGKEATLQPDNAHLAQGASQDYLAPLTWTSGRVYAYLEPPDAIGNPRGQNDKVEVSFYVVNGSEYLNTDITYVDWVALPSQIQTLGTGSDCTTVGCEVPYASILDGCPASLLSGHECLSAGYYCLTTPNPADPYCHALDSRIAACASQYTDCAGAAGSTTAQAYSCSGSFFGTNNEYCAALNRGVLSAPGATTPPSAFYQSPPFNTYSQWVHTKCPGIYAFPYDDYGSSNQSSDHTCTGAKQMNVTFCPKG